MSKVEYYNDLEKLVGLIPPKIRKVLLEKSLDELVEIVLDIGRLPEIRHLSGHIEYLGEDIVTEEEIKFITEKIEDFTNDNRSGIPGTLHRISAIKNRKNKTIGLTCRVGRVVTGTIFCIKDLVAKGKSILFLGRPGVGKTTKLREISRMLADDFGKRVVIVDTSNEIAGDGDIPHKAIGKSRRMQVSSPERQKDVMIEAVENHTPEVVVVDEIGTEEEAQASRTIAERGVMLIATAHGNTLQNLIKNPTLSDLVGGVNSVTLSDDEARRRSTQKTVLEREKKPTFDIVIEIVDRDTLSIYPNVAEAVDYILRDWPVRPEIRKVNQTYESANIQEPANVPVSVTSFEDMLNSSYAIQNYIKEVQDCKKIYIYAVSRSIVDKIIERLGLKAEVTRNIDEADIVIAHKSFSKGGAKILNVAENYRLPIHYVRSNTMPQLQKALKEALHIEDKPGDEVFTEYFDETEIALKEVQDAISKVKNGENEIELEPRKQHIRKLQHEYVEQHNLESTSIGIEPNRRLKIINRIENAS
jgi:stage III sporulation protein SpoIIIAA